MFISLIKFIVRISFVLGLLFSCGVFNSPAYAQFKKDKSSKLNNKKRVKTPVVKRYKCPDKPDKKTVVEAAPKEPEEEVEVYEASIRRAVKKIHFDIVRIKHAELEIPAFKQFKNNMTDFTSHGEEQFEEIIEKIRTYLGDNTNGAGITLRIIGSASQIPTSYDPEKSNNNINSDGSSIVGQTTIENNRKLARARALELAKKIKLVFSEIGINTPSLEQITLGETPWDEEAQNRLNDAVIRGDEQAKQAVFEPFQKEQFVKVESQGEYERKIKPKTIEMHIMSVRPLVSYMENGVEREIIRYVISQKLYEELGGTLQFNTVEERDVFLSQKGIKPYQNPKTNLWYMYQSQKEKKAMSIDDNYTRIEALYELGIVHERDNQILKQIITDKYLKGIQDIVIEY